MKAIFLLLFTALSWTATAQTADGISAPVSRTVKLTADEAAFTVSIAATLDSTQQDVKQALQTAGLPNPTVVATGLGADTSRSPNGPAQMLYSATVTIPAGSAIDTAKNLEALRTHLTAPLQSVQYSVAFNPSQATVEAMRQMVLPQLLDQSRKSAQSLAAAAGVKLGAIRWISDSGGVSGYFLYDPATGSRMGDFSSVLLGAPYSPPSNTQYTFSINVIFATGQ